MQRPAPLKDCLYYPVITAVGLSAVIVTLQWWSGGNIGGMTIDYRAFSTQPWRLVTHVLPHGNILHLAFNLYWLWVFGTLIERVFGSARTFAIMILFAIGSGVAEYALMSGSIGLSGVGYGLFGLLWILGRSDSRFLGSMDEQIVVFFIGWFFFCIVMSATNVMSIGNVAHGSGALLGVLLGWTITARGRLQRIGYVALLTSVFVAIMAAGTGGRRYVNLTGAVAREESYRSEVLAYNAYQAIINNDCRRAVDLFNQALAIDNKRAVWWYNLGIAYQRLKMDKEAADSYSRAGELAPENKDFQIDLENPRGKEP